MGTIIEVRPLQVEGLRCLICNKQEAGVLVNYLHGGAFYTIPCCPGHSAEETIEAWLNLPAPAAGKGEEL